MYFPFTSVKAIWAKVIDGFLPFWSFAVSRYSAFLGFHNVIGDNLHSKLLLGRCASASVSIDPLQPVEVLPVLLYDFGVYVHFRTVEEGA